MPDRLRQILLVLVISGLFAIGIYRLVSTGRLDLHLPQNLIPESITQTGSENQTRVVVSEENAVIDVVEKSSPSVVAISVSSRNVNPFDQNALPSSTNSTIGTGFLVADNIVVTNRHVVDQQNLTFSVFTKDGKKLNIDKIYRDPNLDLALLQVSSSGLTSLALGESGQLKVGQTVIAIGNALGRFNNTVTTGVVSGVGRSIVAGDVFGNEAERLDNLIQTDAAINPGNSGGPLLNSAGQVIGVNVATTGGAQNIGFAIPIDSVKSIIEQFKNNGTVQNPFLGVNYRFITRDLQILHELPQGVYVLDIVNNSPADQAGIESGDIITKLDNQAIDSDTKLSDIIRSKKVGDKVSVELWVNGQTRTVTATLADATTTTNF